MGQAFKQVAFIALFMALAVGGGAWGFLQLANEDHPDMISNWVHEVDDTGTITMARTIHTLYPDSVQFKLIASTGDRAWYLTRYENGVEVADEDQPNTRAWNNLDAAKMYVDALTLLEASFVVERQQTAQDLLDRIKGP